MAEKRYQGLSSDVSLRRALSRDAIDLMRSEEKNIPIALK